MHANLIEYIKDHSTTPLTGREIDIIKENFTPKKFRKHQFLQQEGEVCKYVAFIVKGAMRQYSIGPNGSEHILRLSIENWWAGDRESFEMQTPSRYFVDAWEDTDALIITKEKMDNLDRIAAIKEMRTRLDAKNSFALLSRVNTSISMSSEESYYELEKTYPEFLRRFPQHIIASYLGITKETLSRIRSKALKK